MVPILNFFAAIAPYSLAAFFISLLPIIIWQGIRFYESRKSSGSKRRRVRDD